MSLAPRHGLSGIRLDGGIDLLQARIESGVGAAIY